MNTIATKNISLLVLGVFIIGGVIFFATKQDTKAPTINLMATSTTAGALVVTIESYQFNPSTLTVKKGETVVWTNNDAAPHIVAGDQGTWVPGEAMKQGGSYTRTFDTVGTFAYHCAIHPGMKGTIIVTE